MSQWSYDDGRHGFEHGGDSSHVVGTIKIELYQSQVKTASVLVVNLLSYSFYFCVILIILIISVHAGARFKHYHFNGFP